MSNYMKKALFVLSLVVLATTIVAPSAVKADFWDYFVNPLEIVDDITDCNGPRLPLGGCDTNPQVLNTTTNTNSNNVNSLNTINSNINSPGATVNAQGSAVNTGTNTGGIYTGEVHTTLVGSCYASPSAINAGGSLSWMAFGTGGNGAYTYHWSGTDGLSGSGNAISKNYTVAGTKSASAQVVSGRQIITVQCPTAIVYAAQVQQPQPQPQTQQPQPQALSVYCSADKSRAQISETVGWTASVSGGTGSYSYDWNGTDSLKGSARTVFATYSNSGYKTASVRVTSGNQSTTQNCGTTVYIEPRYQDTTQSYDYYNDTSYNRTTSLDISCYPESSSIDTGERVTWRATATGGTGSYRYEWNGTDSLYNTGSAITKTYVNSGYKTARVTVVSGNQTMTRDCSRGVDVRDRNYTYNDPYYYNYNTAYQSTVYQTYPVYPTYYNTALGGTCSANVNTARPGGLVTWSVSPIGGNGRYTYSWTGTDGLLNYNAIARAQYSITGTKFATVTIFSNGQTAIITCTNSVNVAYDVPAKAVTYTAPKKAATPAYSAGTKPATDAKQTLDASCSVNTGQARVGDSIVWTATATGGTGTYTYAWNGSDALYGQGPIVFKSYGAQGVKMAAVTVSSNGDTVTRACVNTVNIEDIIIQKDLQASASFISTIPWGLVTAVLIILLIAIISYLLLTRPRL